MRFLKNFVRLTVPSIILCIVAGEILFRSLIPGAVQPWGYYDPVEGVDRFEVGQGTGVYTIGKFAQQRGRWRINNAGWNSDIDYFPRNQRTKLLIAIIGDSYIEAFHVDINKSITANLREKLHGRFDVYGFGKSGAPLSHYLQMTRYVVKHFDPDIIVINVIHNDFDESLRRVLPQAYFLQIEINGSEIREASLLSTPMSAKPITKLVFHSAIVRYLYQNLRLGTFWAEHKPGQRVEAKQVAGDEKDGGGQSSPYAVPAPTAEFYKAADYIVGKMREETAGKELVYMIDAPRNDIYNATLRNSRVLWMNNLLAELCKRHRARFIDLTGPFLEKYQKDGVRFNSAYDGHWDQEGHRYAAEVLYNNLVKFGVVKDSQ